MYPETDLETIRIEKEMLEELKKTLPKSTKEREELYITKYSLSPKLAEKMKLSNHAPFFEELVEKKGFDPTNTAALLLEGLVQLKRDGVKIEVISNEMIEGVLRAVKEGRITKDVQLNVLKSWAESPGKELNEIISALGLAKAEKSEIERIIKEIIEKNKSLVEEKGLHAVKALMGEAMRELRGKASGKEINEMLLKEVRKMVEEK
jgi:glutamyl-tRNA(Gln) amidotransferase subunit E